MHNQDITSPLNWLADYEDPIFLDLSSQLRPGNVVHADCQTVHPDHDSPHLNRRIICARVLSFELQL